MFNKIHTAIASTLLLAGFVCAPAFAGNAALPKCGATATTDIQPGYVSCLGAFDGNMDGKKVLPGIFDMMAKSAANGGFGFSTNTYFSSEGFKAAANPFAQDEGSKDDGIINFDKALTGSFVLGLKQGPGYSLYLFDGSKVAGGISSIAYDTLGVKTEKGGNGLDLSHAGFFGTPVSAVPEADTYAMLLAGLGMIGFVARRRKAK